MQLEGKVAAITGGTRGIGRGIAEAFLREGARVAVNGRNPEKGAGAIAEMNADERAFFYAGDVMKRSDVEGFIDETVRRFGRIDILVNNAGGSSGFAPIVDLSDEAWLQAIDWNLNSTFWGTRRAFKYMIPQQWGRVINISSVEGKQAKPSVAPYVTMKHAINGFTKAAAKEVGTLGITVNAICPGLVITDLLMEAGPAAAEAMGLTFDQFVAQYAAEAATKRVNTVEEVAAMAVLVASDVGAGITGALLSVDGGTTAY
ncbi:MAG: SDR family oxidoreductase [Dehalococcoidia bacterium]|nr:SDR family oxidoreductase [Dehalococcoidia bacterium]